MLRGLDQAIDYLHTKISKINLNNQKSNQGGVLIKTHKGWEDKLPGLVVIAFQVIQTQFTRTGSGQQLPGKATLTATSMSVAKAIVSRIHREPITTRQQLRLGDLMIEGFVYHGFANVISPPRGSREPCILEAAPKWKEELCYISDEHIALSIVGTYNEPPALSSTIHKEHTDLYDPDAIYTKAVAKLQNVQWTINSDVLEAIDKDRPNEEPIIDNDAKELRRRSKAIERKFTVGKAKILDEWDGFYQGYDLDYRGRMYATEPFLNYQSNDMAKGLLLFNESKAIDNDGKFWMKVHTAASYNANYHKDEIPVWCEADYKTFLESEGLEDISVDKMTLNDRARWTDENMDMIFNWSVMNIKPADAEKPWVFLACCHEWVKITETGTTSLPVAIDGSNNGWQHLGAMSKDVETGKLVGLVPTEIQHDFYVQTAKQLIILAEKDKRLSGILEPMPMKHIRKGVSKRGSMTRAYSAGAAKIAENMYFDCQTEDYHEKYGITRKDCTKLAKLLVKAIEIVCPGPLKTMAYLQDLASFELGTFELEGGPKKEKNELSNRRSALIERGKNITDKEIVELNAIVIRLSEFKYKLIDGNGERFITWKTPSGFTARYEKFLMDDFQEKAYLNGKRISHKLRTPLDIPDKHKFMCGIAPNFVHSLDASHLAITVYDWDGAFGAVHDSYSTHANDVEALLARTKQVFIDMYDRDNYLTEVRQLLTNNTDNIEPPEIGELDIGAINDSEYFFA